MASKSKSWKTCKVTLRRSDGTRLTTIISECLGTWTYHPSHNESDRWSVTHVSKGGVALYCENEQDARRCVEFLGIHWSKGFTQLQARQEALMDALKRARSEGTLLFYFSYEKFEVLQRFQEDQWERELVAQLSGNH